MIVIAILGLVIPGYALARALRSPVPWAVAFPLSALVLIEIVTAYTLLGIPLRFGYVLCAELVVVLAALAVEFRRNFPASPKLYDNGANEVSKPFVVLAAVLVSFASLGILVRTTLYPLSGPDTALRWNALPRLMLEYQNLSYYPPLTAKDFAKYFVPDSFPPLVAGIYWWLYAAWDSPWARLTSVAIFLEAVSCFALVFFAARILFGRAGGVLAVTALSSSAFFLVGVAIGQENGLMAISYAGQLLFAYATIREPKANSVVIAGLFAGLGALRANTVRCCHWPDLLCSQADARRAVICRCFALLQRLRSPLVHSNLGANGKSSLSDGYGFGLARQSSSRRDPIDISSVSGNSRLPNHILASSCGPDDDWCAVGVVAGAGGHVHRRSPHDRIGIFSSIRAGALVCLRCQHGGRNWLHLALYHTGMGGLLDRCGRLAAYWRPQPTGGSSFSVKPQAWRSWSAAATQC